MKAIIMCGGEGTRLRPLTCDTPKPLTRLCGRPTVEYILDLLCRNGITEAALTLKYLPQEIVEYFTQHPYKGMQLQFIEEDAPLGTAGSVKNAEEYLGGGDFVVISGDALCDIDLEEAIAFHRQKKAQATLVLADVTDPREYGVVVCDAQGRVERFVEKPNWTQAVTNMANTGIYVLQSSVLRLIPQGKPFDFAQDLFPLMLSKHLPIFGFQSEGYWCDIGDVSTYLSCQADMLAGEVNCRIEAERTEGIYHKEKLPAGEYTIHAPAYIGRNVRIGRYAEIGPNVVLDDNCYVGDDASVRHSVLLPGAYVGNKAEVRGAVICHGASVESGGAMFEGSVLGSHARVGVQACVSPNVRVWPDKCVEENTRAGSNVKWGNVRPGVFDDDGVTGESGVEMTTGLCACVGQALATVKSRGRVAVADDGSLASQIYKKALVSGIQSAGGEVVNLGTTWEAMLSYAVRTLGADAGVYCDSAGNRTSLRLCGADGLPLTRKEERKIEGCLRSAEYARCGFEDYREELPMRGMELFYAASLEKFAPAGLDGVRYDLDASRGDLMRFTQRLLDNLGAVKQDGALKLHLGLSGRSLTAFTETGEFISEGRMLAMQAVISFAGGCDVAAPADAPAVLEKLAERYRQRVLRYAYCPADDCDRAAREVAAEQFYLRDAAAGAVRLLAYLKKRGITLDAFNGEIPQFAVKARDIVLECDTHEAVRRLMGVDNRIDSVEGVRVQRDGGAIYIRPFKRGGGIRVLAEAPDEEIADELCADLEKLF